MENKKPRLQQVKWRYELRARNHIELAQVQGFTVMNMLRMLSSLAITREIIAGHDFKTAWKRYEIMRHIYGHCFDVLIIRQDLVDSWREWPFSVSFEPEGRLGISDYLLNDVCALGFMGQFLSDCRAWSSDLTYVKMPMMNSGRRYAE